MQVSKRKIKQQNGDLHKYLKHTDLNKEKRFDQYVAGQLFMDIVRALDHCHNTLQIAHRDLKLENILLDNKFRIKIADFGLCKIMESYNNNNNQNSEYGLLKASRKGTPGYMAPELIRSDKFPIKDTPKYRQASDIFSLGIILWKIFNGLKAPLPFTIADPDACNNYKLIYLNQYNQWWNKFENKIICYTDESIKYLFINMFTCQVEKRITIKQIMQKSNFFDKHANAKFVFAYEKFFQRRMQDLRSKIPKKNVKETQFQNNAPNEPYSQSGQTFESS